MASHRLGRRGDGGIVTALGMFATLRGIFSARDARIREQTVKDTKLDEHARILTGIKEELVRTSEATRSMVRELEAAHRQAIERIHERIDELYARFEDHCASSHRKD